MLSTVFSSYVRRAKNVCFYRIGSQPFTPSLSFPHATTVTLIHCSREGVNRLLSPSFFPKLTTVHYLSAHPGQIDLYRRFPKEPTWLFPNRLYDFYDCMILAGHGRVENRLLRTYLHNLQVHPHGIEVSLNLPGYGPYRGDRYRSQMIEYLQTPYVPMSFDTNPDVCSDMDPFCHDPYFECGSGSLSSFLQDRMERDFFRSILRDCEKEEKNTKPCVRS